MGEPKDFMDIYLLEIEKERKKYGSNYSHETSDFHIEQLVVTCMDFFSAGSETTSTILSWAVMYLACNVEVQKRCQQEIESYLGDRTPTKNDAQRLVYCTATIEEIQRISGVGPGSLPYVVTKDVEMKGFHFPKGTIFMANITKFLRDPCAFPEPTRFLPERFLTTDKDGTRILQKNKQNIPFGIGKRVCLGESLARMELFIFLVMMLQRLNFDLPDNHPPPDDTN